LTDERYLSGGALPKSVVVLELPHGRELLWLGPDSAIAGWQVDDEVSFRRTRWRVTSRVTEPDSLRLRLRPT
jgi:hypothetical protein